MSVPMAQLRHCLAHAPLGVPLHNLKPLRQDAVVPEVLGLAKTNQGGRGTPGVPNGTFHPGTV